MGADRVDLFLDDVREPSVSGWTVVRTAEEAQDLLRHDRVREATLDHDLGECEACKARGEKRDRHSLSCRHRMTGYDLVKWMAETGCWPRSKPTVHSANPVGKASMVATIDRYWNAERRPA